MSKYKLLLLLPNGIFFWALLLTYYLPSLYTITLIDELNLDPSVKNSYVIANTIFIVLVYLSLIFFSNLKNKPWLFKLYKKEYESNNSIINLYLRTKYTKFKSYLIIFNLTVIFAFLFLGLPKLILLGSYISAEEFRFIGYDDRSYFYTVILELLRRVAYPCILLFLFMFLNINSIVKNSIYKYTLFSFFLICLIGLDRSPFVIFFGLLIYIFIFLKKNKFYIKLLIFLSLLSLLSFSIAYVSFLQYNNLDFDYKEVYDLSKKIILNRIILDPAYMSYKYSFEVYQKFQDFLFLKYSRLTSLITGTYVGSTTDISFNIAPVSFIGDIWRNFGYPGIFIFPIILAFLINKVNIIVLSTSLYISQIIIFLFIIYTFYLIIGGLFSYGPNAIYLIMLLLPKIEIFFKNQNLKKNYYEKII